MAPVLRGDVRWADLSATLSQIRTLAAERLGRRIARISPEETAQVVEGLNEIIGQ